MQTVACLQQPAKHLELQLFNFNSGKTLGKVHQKRNIKWERLTLSCIPSWPTETCSSDKTPENIAPMMMPKPKKFTSQHCVPKFARFSIRWSASMEVYTKNINLVPRVLSLPPSRNFLEGGRERTLWTRLRKYQTLAIVRTGRLPPLLIINVSSSRK